MRKYAAFLRVVFPFLPSPTPIHTRFVPYAFEIGCTRLLLSQLPSARFPPQKRRLTIGFRRLLRQGTHKRRQRCPIEAVFLENNVFERPETVRKRSITAKKYWSHSMTTVRHHAEIGRKSFPGHTGNDKENLISNRFVHTVGKHVTAKRVWNTAERTKRTKVIAFKTAGIK